MLADLAPIVIASPIQRSGTTLLQRLLCSARDALIFGETCANDLNMLLGLLMQKRGMYGRNDGWRGAQLQRVLQGEVNEWIPDLMPDTNGYLQQFEVAVTNFLGHFAAFARQHDRPHWGMKLPGWNVSQLDQILRMMPKTRILFIVRDLEACVRSAKAVNFCQDLESTRQFAEFWKMNLQNAHRLLKRPEVLWIQYHTLTSYPEETIQRIEQFAGLREIDRSVMKHRVRGYQGENLKLTELLMEEKKLIREFEAAASAY